MKEPTRTVKTFKMMQNVETFVKAMEGYGVKSLFTPTELINKTNMMNVVMSLQDLAEVVENLILKKNPFFKQVL